MLICLERFDDDDDDDQEEDEDGDGGAGNSESASQPAKKKVYYCRAWTQVVRTSSSAICVHIGSRKSTSISFGN